MGVSDVKIGFKDPATSGLSHCHGESCDVHLYITASLAQTSCIIQVRIIMAESISMEEIRNAMSTQKLKQLDRSVIFPLRAGSILPSVLDDKMQEMQLPNKLNDHSEQCRSVFSSNHVFLDI